MEALLHDTVRERLADALGGRVFYGWVIVAVAAFCLFSTGPGQSHTFSAFNRLIAEDLGLSLTDVSWAYGAATVAAAFLLPLFGRQIERYGPRLGLMAAAALLGLACLLFGAVANMLWLGVGFAALRFFGQGAMMLGSANLVAQWFSARRGFAMGLMALGFAASMAVHPTLAKLLIGWFGWREAWVGLGLLTWLTILPVLAFLVQDRPEAMGLRPDGAEPSADGAAPPLSGVTLEDALRHPSFYICALGLFLIAGFATALHFHQYNIMEAQGLTTGAATLGFWCTAISMVCLMPLVGRGFDRFRTRYMFAAALLVQAAALVGVTFVGSIPALVVYSIAFGLNNAFSMTMFGYIWPRYFGRRHLGRIQGTGQMIGVVGASLGPIPVSLAFDLTGDPALTLRWLAVLPVVAAVIAVVFLRTATAVTGDEHLE